MLVHASSASGNHAQALQLSQISPDQLNQSDDLLFARAIALQRAGKTHEAIDAFQTFLNTFPKSPMTPGVKIRLALALADNHQAGDAIATLRDLLATAAPDRGTSISAAEESPDEDNSASSDEDESADQDNSASSNKEESADENKTGSNEQEETDDEKNSQSDDEKQTSDETTSESEGATGYGAINSYPSLTRLYMSDSEDYTAVE